MTESFGSLFSPVNLYYPSSEISSFPKMSSSKSLFLALIVAVSHANAVFNSSSQALNRSSQALNSSSQALNSSSQVLNSSSQALRNDPPTPSIYPLGEPCVPEWQYLNFNPKDANHKAHLEKLHDVICSGELRAVLSYGELSVKDGLAPYKRYFPLSDEEKDFQEESDYQTNVKDVLHLISEEDVGDGIIGTVVGTFVVDNFGEFHICAVIFTLSLFSLLLSDVFCGLFRSRVPQILLPTIPTRTAVTVTVGPLHTHSRINLTAVKRFISATPRGLVEALMTSIARTWTPSRARKWMHSRAS